MSFMRFKTSHEQLRKLQQRLAAIRDIQNKKILNNLLHFVHAKYQINLSGKSDAWQ